MSVRAPHFFASSTVIVIALRVVGNCARQTNASAIAVLNLIGIVDLRGRTELLAITVDPRPKKAAEPGKNTSDGSG